MDKTRKEWYNCKDIIKSFGENTMQFLVLSDSHGRYEKINRILSRAHRCDGVFFLGDGLRDLSCCDINNLYAVKGNCDYFSLGVGDYEDSLTLTLGNKKIFMTHGHRYGVKHGLDSLIYAAAENDADIVLFGHTHQREEMRLVPEKVPSLNKPVYFFNPGSIADGSFGRLDITLRGEILFSHGEV